MRSDDIIAIKMATLFERCPIGLDYFSGQRRLTAAQNYGLGRGFGGTLFLRLTAYPSGSRARLAKLLGMSTL